MNIGGVNNLNSIANTGAVRQSPATSASADAGASTAPPEDLVQVGVQPAVDSPPKAAANTGAEASKSKSELELRQDFKSSIAALKNQSEDDKNFLSSVGKQVSQCSELNSKGKECLFAAQVRAYAADVATELSGKQRTPAEDSRLSAMTDAFGAAKALYEAVAPPPESTPAAAAPSASLAPSFESALPGQSLSAAPATPASSGSAAAAAPANPPAPAPDPSTPPAPPPDPLVAIWESRRKEAQDVFTDFKALMKMISDSKQRIMASRIAYFWKTYGAHQGYMNETWRK